MRYWSIRAGNEGEAKAFCLQQSVIAMDWDIDDMGLLPDDREAFKARYREKHPEDNFETVDHIAGTNYRFVYKIQAGDYVVLAPKIESKDPNLYIGQVEGSYYFNASPHPDPKLENFKHQRKVKWLAACPRGEFSEAFLKSVGSSQTLVSMEAHADELRAKLRAEEHG